MSEAVILREIGLRDGLQLVKGELPTEQKLEWIAQAVASGVDEIEVTSFVPPRAFPIFADAAQVAAAAVATPRLRASALAVNLRGARDAMTAKLRKVSYVVSASEAHSLANVRRSTADAIMEFEHIVALRHEMGLADAVVLSCGVATAFGCTLQGEVSLGEVVTIAERLVAIGASEIMLADTVGYANPSQVERLVGEVRNKIPHIALTGHFHDTRGLGLANVAMAARAGVRGFDGSIGGLGGCPFAPGATGNVNFEDMAFMLETMGYHTGIDVRSLLELRRNVERWLPGERLTGAVLRSGLPKTYTPVP